MTLISWLKTMILDLDILVFALLSTWNFYIANIEIMQTETPNFTLKRGSRENSIQKQQKWAFFRIR